MDYFMGCPKGSCQTIALRRALLLALHPVWRERGV